MNRTVSVLILGGDALTRQGCAHILSPGFNVTVLPDATDSGAVAEAARIHRPEWVVVMGWGVDLHTVTSAVTDELDRRPRFLLIHDHDSRPGTEDIITTALELGYEGVLSSKTAMEMLAEILTTDHEDVVLLSPEAVRRVATLGAAGTGRIDASGLPEEDAALIHKNRDLIRYVAQGLSNKQIAAHIGKSEALVKLRVKLIMRALNARNRTQIATFYLSGSTASDAEEEVQPIEKPRSKQSSDGKI